MNPLVLRKGVCDPHIHIFEGKAYLYATHDAPGYGEGFHMDDWQIWSSEDLVDWKLESTIHPEDFYCGGLNQCWALDAAYKNGKYYLYFSTGYWGVGVAVSDHPAGPFVDVLGEPLVDYRVYPEGVPKWDPCVFIDDDGSAYLIAGTTNNTKPWDCYLIARLEDDMMHLAEPLRRLEYVNNPCREDKPSVHKYGEKYYLTHSSYYAVSDNVYGPYRYVGNSGCNIDHGSFFTYHNQTYFASGGMDNASQFLRASFLAPCHYRQSGDIVVDQKIMEYGCGQYDASWKKIDADWYFAASRDCKKEGKDGTFSAVLEKGDYLYFPNIAGVGENAVLRVLAGGGEETVLRIYEKTENDKTQGEPFDEKKRKEIFAGDWSEIASDCDLLGSVVVGKEEKFYETALSCSRGKKSLLFVADGPMEFKWFSFDTGRKRYTLEPVFSWMGGGASLDYDRNASFHQTLRNMELRGAFMEALADGGCGCDGLLEISYTCVGSPVCLEVEINGENQGSLEFPVTGKELRIGSIPTVYTRAVSLQSGLNRVRLYSKEYQKGMLAIDSVTVVSAQSSCAVYSAANGILEPRGNGCWDGLPQRETDPRVFSGRKVKILEKPGYSVTIEKVDGGAGGKHHLDIHYCRKEAGESSFELEVNGATVQLLDFPSTGGDSSGEMKTLSTTVDLKAGSENSICLRKSQRTDKGIFLDAFAVYN